MDKFFVDIRTECGVKFSGVVTAEFQTLCCAEIHQPAGKDSAGGAGDFHARAPAEITCDGNSSGWQKAFAVLTNRILCSGVNGDGTGYL